jgi:hypothetical protein
VFSSLEEDDNVVGLLKVGKTCAVVEGKAIWQQGCYRRRKNALRNLPMAVFCGEAWLCGPKDQTTSGLL